MPGDGRVLGLDYSQLENLDTNSRGAGGPIRSYKEPAWVAFTDGTELFGYSIELGILENRDDMLNVPSLLGRDILHRWRMTYQYSMGLLQVEVETADVVVPLPAPFQPPGAGHD
jgi:hypothetical protein